ncbi:MAG TPA: hypothetical protein DGC76_06760 [Candidatus Accumulibacter sp.]|nr:hypothetical protein [Accumulibacter sp.]
MLRSFIANPDVGLDSTDMIFTLLKHRAGVENHGSDHPPRSWRSSSATGRRSAAKEESSSNFTVSSVCRETGAVHVIKPTLGVCYCRREKKIVKDIVWDQILSVGVDEIDEDHRKLVDIFNILNHSVLDDESPEYIAAALAELINCTVWHFSHEERLMLKHRYEGIEEHKAEHQELIRAPRNCKKKTFRRPSLWWLNITSFSSGG